MKKLQLNILPALTAVFAAFIIGFFMGRNYNHTDVQLSVLPTSAPVQSVNGISLSEAPLAPETAATAAREQTAPPNTQPMSPEATAPSDSLPTEPQPTDPQPTAAETTPSSSGLININTATQAQLETLPGIGEVLAGRIIAYRETYGPFTSVTQLINVSGIGEKRLAAIIDLVTIE